MREPSSACTYLLNICFISLGIYDENYATEISKQISSKLRKKFMNNIKALRYEVYYSESNRIFFKLSGNISISFGSRAIAISTQGLPNVPLLQCATDFYTN